MILIHGTDNPTIQLQGHRQGVKFYVLQSAQCFLFHGIAGDGLNVGYLDVLNEILSHNVKFAPVQNKNTILGYYL